MGSRVEQFEQIRRDRDREGLSLRALAVRFPSHRCRPTESVSDLSEGIWAAVAAYRDMDDLC